MPRIEHRTVAQQTPDPVELGGIGGQPWRSKDVIEMNGLIQHRDDGAILRRNIVEINGPGKAGGPRLVLRHDSWLAWEELADISSDQAAIGVVAAAWCCRDDERNGL